MLRKNLSQTYKGSLSGSFCRNLAQKNHYSCTVGSWSKIYVGVFLQIAVALRQCGGGGQGCPGSCAATYIISKEKAWSEIGFQESWWFWKGTRRGNFFEVVGPSSKAISHCLQNQSPTPGQPTNEAWWVPTSDYIFFLSDVTFFNLYQIQKEPATIKYTMILDLQLQVPISSWQKMLPPPRFFAQLKQLYTMQACVGFST